MKKLLFLFIFLPIISHAQEDRVIDPSEIFIKDYIAYFKKDSTLVNGLVNGWYQRQENFGFKIEATFIDVGH